MLQLNVAMSSSDYRLLDTNYDFKVKGNRIWNKVKRNLFSTY
jgi:hypothetical protein